MRPPRPPAVRRAGDGCRAHLLTRSSGTSQRGHKHGLQCHTGAVSEHRNTNTPHTTGPTDATTCRRAGRGLALDHASCVMCTFDSSICINLSMLHFTHNIKRGLLVHPVNKAALQSDQEAGEGKKFSFWSFLSSNKLYFQLTATVVKVLCSLYISVLHCRLRAAPEPFGRVTASPLTAPSRLGAALVRGSLGAVPAGSFRRGKAPLGCQAPVWPGATPGREAGAAVQPKAWPCQSAG